MSAEPRPPVTVKKTYEYRGHFLWILEEFRLCVSFHALVNLEVTVGSCPLGMNNPLRDALPVKVRHLLDVDGQRVLSEVESVELKNYETRINKYLRQQRTIEKEHKDAFKRLKKYLKEEKLIRDTDKVYKIDTELYQIMTCFKMSFVNLCSLFLARCMDHEKFELQTIFESIFQLGGVAFIANEEKRIELEMNPKEPELMDKLNKGLRILNMMDILDPGGHSIRFNMQIFCLN